MIPIIKKAERVTKVYYDRYFEWADKPGAGFSFPCDKDGNIDLTTGMCVNKEARENLEGCLSGKFNVIDKGVVRRVHTYKEPALAKCICGHIIELAAFTNTCEKCARDYNLCGQELAPRSQWGEETGETSEDILRLGHHVS